MPAQAATATPRHGRPTLPDHYRRLSQLVLAACILIIGTIWLITWQRISTERSQAFAAADLSNANLALALAWQLNRTLNGTEQLARLVSQIWLRDGSLPDLASLAHTQLLREHPELQLGILDAHGQLLHSSATAAGNKAELVRQGQHALATATADQHLQFHPPSYDSAAGRWHVPVSLVARNTEGKPAAAVLIALPPATLSGFYLHADFGEHALFDLSTRDGLVLGRIINKQLLEHSGSLTPLAVLPPDTASAGSEHAFSFSDNGDHSDGRRRLLSVRMLDSHPLQITVGRAESEILAPLQHNRLIYLFMASAGSLAFIIAALLLRRSLRQQQQASRALGVSEAVFRATFNQAAMGIAHLDPAGHITNANEKFCQLLGRPLSALQGQQLNALEEDRLPDPAASLHLNSAGQASRETAYRRPDGGLQWVLQACSTGNDSDAGSASTAFEVVVMYDINPRKRLEEKLAHAALHDGLTGLPNRRLFAQRLEQALAVARRHQQPLGILFIDLDGFKAVNDSLGHAAGDEVLIRTAQRLRACIRQEDSVARFGGDEFGVLLVNPSQPDDCEAVAQKIIQALSLPIETGRQRIMVSASVGIVGHPSQGKDAQTLLELADAAMYAAKRAGKNRFRWSPSPTAFRQR